MRPFMTSSPASDAIVSIRLSSCYLPLATPISDAKVLTGRQKPMTEVAILFAEIRTAAWKESACRMPIAKKVIARVCGEAPYLRTNR